MLWVYVHIEMGERWSAGGMMEVDENKAGKVKQYSGINLSCMLGTCWLEWGGHDFSITERANPGHGSSLCTSNIPISLNILDFCFHQMHLFNL